MISATHNLLLRTLSPTALKAVLDVSEFVHLDVRETLIEPDQPIAHVDFPESGVMSLLQPLENGVIIEIANIGFEGMVGMQVAFGVATTGTRCFCQVQGTVLRIPTDTFVKLLIQHPELAALCQRYAMTLVDQISRNSGCNGIHTMEERCAKWLLLTHDRCHLKPFVLTQDFLAIMLGVSRTMVNLAAKTLANANLISYTRGKVTVLDRAGLEEVVCPCYASMARYFKDVMATTPILVPVVGSNNISP